MYILNIFIFLETRVRKAWTTPERHIARKLFATEISTGKVPTVQKCKESQMKYNELANRPIAHLKSWVQAESRRQKRS